jgi:hypothetical protein
VSAIQYHEATEMLNDTETINREDSSEGVITVADSLFYDNSFDEYLQGKHKNIWREVDGIPQENFLGMSDQEMDDYLIPRLELMPIVLYEDLITHMPFETKVEIEDYGRRINVDGLGITLSIPYSGEPGYWKMKPNPWREPHPKGVVFPPDPKGIGHVEITLKMKSSTSPEYCTKEVKHVLDSVKYYIEVQRKHINQYNRDLPVKIQEAVKVRRDRLEKHSAMIRSLNIPLKRREGVPDISRLPIKRKLVRPLPAPPSKQPNIGIADDDYEHILKVVRHEGRSYETTPKTFIKLDEEELRDIIIAHLNGHYEGDATGETFRRSGKTDIRIENNDRAAFVAECKVWRGACEFSQAINQLLDYLTWRDCKTSMIIFNKHNSGFKQIQDQLPELLKKHSQFEKNLDCKTHGEWRCIFRSMDDPERKVIVHIFVFNLYVKKRV